MKVRFAGGWNDLDFESQSRLGGLPLNSMVSVFGRLTVYFDLDTSFLPVLDMLFVLYVSRSLSCVRTQRLCCRYQQLPRNLITLSPFRSSLC